MNLLARFTGAAKQPSEPTVSPTYSPEHSEAAKQRELTVELARLLARRPASPRAITRAPCEFDETDTDTETEDEAADETLSGIDNPASKRTAEVSMSPPPLPAAHRTDTSTREDPPAPSASQTRTSQASPAAHSTAQHAAEPARWVATSKRARFNTGVRKAASWMISIFTGVFIFAVVALIVLGPPKDYDKIIEWPSKTIALSSTDIAPSLTTRTASDLETRSVKIHQFRLSQDEPVRVFADQGR